MLTLNDCQEINSAVRSLFKSGPKSSNKIYLPNSENLPGCLQISEERTKGAIASIELPKHAKRLEDRSAAQKMRIKNLAPGMAGAAQLLDAREARQLAGNCGEMAILAAGLASEQDPSAQVWKCSLGEFDNQGHKHDHVFCLIQPSMKELLAAGVKGMDLVYLPGRVSDLDAVARNLQFLIIDPWLNVACQANDYLTQVKAKLVKWDQAQKRILFGGNYYRPADKSYVNAFTNAKIVATKFT